MQREVWFSRRRAQRIGNRRAAIAQPPQRAV